MQTDSRERAKPENFQAGAADFWEKLFGLCGLLLTVGALIYLLYRALNGADTPPHVVFRIESISARGETYLVRFSAQNHGEQTAAALLVEGALSKDGVIVEKSSAELDFLPAGSRRAGGLFFTHNPEELDIEIRATGFMDP
jgi:uncharacterized protein (TIGR02588 family)